MLPFKGEAKDEVLKGLQKDKSPTGEKGEKGEKKR